MNRDVLEAVCEASWEDKMGGDWEWAYAGIHERVEWRENTKRILRAAGLNVEED